MPTRRRLLACLAFAPVAAALPGRARASAPAVFAEDGIAIHGADPVGYFREGGPVPGRPEHALMWRGAIWRFASRRNRLDFEMNPRAYAPAFGGYCAWAVSNGGLATTAPEAWTIYQGRLYLTNSLAVRARWREDIPGNVARGEANWPSVLD